MGLQALRKVFSSTAYQALAITISVSVFAFAVWLPNWRFIVTVIASPSVSFTEAVGVIFGLFLSIGTNFKKGIEQMEQIFFSISEAVK